MKITRTSTSMLSNLLQSLRIKATTNKNSTLTLPTVASLKSKTINTGYDKSGNDIVYNTSTNQKISNPNTEVQDSTNPANKYTGSLTASQLLEKFANGDTLSDEEYDYMSFETKSSVFDAAFQKRNIILDEQNVSRVLAKNNIQLAPDQELRISIDCQNKLTVSGINDPEKCKKIENDLSSEANNLAGLFRVNSETYKNVSGDYKGAAQGFGEAEQYLNQQTNGKISVTDLSIEDGKIVGLTPELDRLLNREFTPQDCIDFDKQAAYVMKAKIVGAIAHLKVNGTENLPQMNFTLSYKNGKLSCIEQPNLVEQHPETKTSEQYDKEVMSSLDDPIGYYYQYTASASNDQ